MSDQTPLSSGGGTMTESGQTQPSAVFISDGSGGLTLAWSNGIVTTWTWDDTPGARGYYATGTTHSDATSKIVWECTQSDTDGNCVHWNWASYSRPNPTGPWQPVINGTAKKVGS